MTILNDIGIQQWRIRRSASEIEAASSQASMPTSNGSNTQGAHAKSNFAAPSNTESSIQESSTTGTAHIERRIWPAETKASSELLEPQESKSEKSLPESSDPGPSVLKSKSAIAPSPMPIGNQASAEKPGASIPKPMPTPMPTPMPAPMPASVSTATAEPIYTQAFDSSDPAMYEPLANTIGSLDSLGWNGLHALVNGWQNCPSCGENKSLLGHGDENADWFFISDAPSTAEISQKSLFAARSGQLFEAMLSALGLQRESVYSTSLFKCVASDDVNVIPACDNILQRQIQLVKPKIIITFGEFAAQTLLKANAKLDVLRTQNQRCISSKIVVIPTYTPAQMLDDVSLKSKVWADLKQAIAIVNMPT
jgi:DNA polymerase